MSVVDFYPTFVELAGGSHFKTGSNGKAIHEIQGHSLLPVLLAMPIQSVRTTLLMAGKSLAIELSAKGITNCFG
jgi:hypothetical protein